MQISLQCNFTVYSAYAVTVTKRMQISFSSNENETFYHHHHHHPARHAVFFVAWPKWFEQCGKSNSVLVLWHVELVFVMLYMESRLVYVSYLRVYVYDD